MMPHMPLRDTPLDAASGLDGPGTATAVERMAPESSRDVAVSFETLEHPASPELLIAECRRALAPGGIFILTLDAVSQRTGD
jgi:SAM-dependent methyltransferase